MTELGSLRSVQIGRFVLAVPLGATEQHGPHLPVHTDTVIATELCRRLAERCPEAVVAPPLPYGSSGEHAGFAGTLSIGQQALDSVLVELARSADRFAGVVLVNAHGGNAEPVRRAVATLRAEGRSVSAWSPPGDPRDSHAGRVETSVMLALAPDQVDMAAAAPGATASLRELWPRLRAGGVAAVSDNGVLGDPTGASAAEGATVLDAWTRALYAWFTASG